jgi:histidine triad (HIT) family protein
MEDSIFTKIIKGEIPSYKVFENDKVLAFLDIHPIQPGQVLVIPKHQVAFVWDLADEEYQAVMTAAQQIARRLRQVFPEKSHVALIVEGLDVPHAHLKVFPFDTDAEFRSQPDLQAEPDHAALADMAKKLAF